jgi:hypothetical protein
VTLVANAKAAKARAERLSGDEVWREQFIQDLNGLIGRFEETDPFRRGEGLRANVPITWLDLAARMLGPCRDQRAACLDGSGRSNV